VKGNKELTFIMILPLQMFDITQSVSDQNQMSPVYLFIQILIGFQPNRFLVQNTAQKNPKFMEQIKSMLFVFRFLFIL
jgi:hypothetical protein